MWRVPRCVLFIIVTWQTPQIQAIAQRFRLQTGDNPSAL